MSSTVLTANREIKLQESGTTELLPTVHLFGAILGVTIMMIMILGGNGLVIWTYICERRLHKFASSLYILNIAVCDFLIGAVSVPIHFYYTVNQRVWTLGKSSCKIKILIDYVTGMESTFLFILFAIDLSVKLKRKMLYFLSVDTKRRAVVKIAISWCCSVAVYAPAVIGWDVGAGNSSVKLLNCKAEFQQKPYFIFTSTISELLFPFVITIFIGNSCLWINKKRELVHKDTVSSIFPELSSALSYESRRALKGNAENAFAIQNKSNLEDQLLKQQQDFRTKVAQDFEPKTMNLNSTSSEGLLSTINEERESQLVATSSEGFKSIIFKCDERDDFSAYSFHSLLEREKHLYAKVKEEVPPATECPRVLRISVASDTRRKSRLLMKQIVEHAIGINLLICMTLFIVVWVPYTVCAQVRSICLDCVQDGLVEVFTWLRWSKTLVDPFLITTLNIFFRRIFVRVLVNISSVCTES